MSEAGQRLIKSAQDEKNKQRAPERIWVEVCCIISGELQWEAGDWAVDPDDLMPEMGPHMEYVRADTIEALQAKLREAEGALERLPDGFWEVWTSNSFRRISRQGGGDGDVLCGITHKSDGHPDLSWNEAQCQALCDLVNGLRAALAALRER
ncbi:hypothetical protein [Roseovarius sp. MMSF_3350]|uniref:hypothetical protein n=1 Tax=Roseovarius sp. MMSF_3350 TaxID=3046706 RepID=UPI00273FC38A|nr:hypothetical protein [Roseovarius sp. MMSF_3350]